MTADEAIRVRQGADMATSPAILRELATDPSVTVRASLAFNPALPEQVSAILAADTDARVRAILRRKLTTLTPALPDDAHRRGQQDAVASLTAMIADAALRIRTNIAAAVRDLPDGPREIVLRLAHDPAVTVCEPVIRFSPMLTQEDLIALIASEPPPSTILAVANRPAIGFGVSDAIVGTADLDAIRALLANHSAQIRENTLDSLAAQSEEHTSWQQPLVHRPHLPAVAQRMLSEIVTGHLLETLAARRDLDPKVSQALRATLLSDHAANKAKQSAGPWIAPPGGNRGAVHQVQMGAQTGSWTPDRNKQAAFSQAQALMHAGKLDDYAILEALRRNEMLAAGMMVAVKADVPVSIVDRACDLRSAKAIVSLAWKARTSPQTAVVLQGMLARLSPDLILRPGPNGEWPLSEQEMRWQLNFLGVGATEKRSWTPRRLSQ